jgi:type IV pilus assembly protein PilQ
MVGVRLTRSCPRSPNNNPPQAANPAVPSSPAPGGAVTTPSPATQTQDQPGASINTIQSFQCPQRGAVVADTITNSVAISDVPGALDDLERYARSLDIRQPQVNIKAKIILVDRTTIEGLGLRYDLGSQQQFFNDIVPRLDSLGQPLTTAGQIVLGGNTVSAIANATARVPSAALQLVFSTAMGNFDFTTFLEALQQNTLLDVQAEPSVSISNNHTANLTAGTEVPIRVIDAGGGGTQTSNFPRANVNFRQTGVILTVTPQITANRQVQMKVHVENSSVQFQTSDVGAVFPKQSVDNEMLVADGETMVVGGLTQTEVNVTKTGLPILVDLPIIGRLFGVTNRTETKRDLLILITPHVIDEGSQAAVPEVRRP